jgi:hypothetical protein
MVVQQVELAEAWDNILYITEEGINKILESEIKRE